MKLKSGYTYGGRWRVDEKDRIPISDTSYDVYYGCEQRDDDPDYMLNYRWVMLKTIHYQPGTNPEDVLRRRKAFDHQIEVLALGHFMLPEAYDYCRIPNHHTPCIAGTNLADSEPLLVYSYSPGFTLREYVKGETRGTGGPMSPLDALDVIHRIASFTSILHNKGYGHIAVNPDHFVYHRGSLRALGLSKIVPLEASSGAFRPYEPPFFRVQERAFLPGEALVNGHYTVRTEHYGLGLLLYYLVTGCCPSTFIQQPTDHLPHQELERLPICPEAKVLIQELITTSHGTDERDVSGIDATLRARLNQVCQAQKAYEETEALRSQRVAILVDLENMVAAFTPRGSTADMPLDLEAIAAAYARREPTHKFAVVPRHRTRGRIQGDIADLMRAGWHILLVDPLFTPDGKPIMGEVDDSYLVREGSRFLDVADTQNLVIVSNDSDYLALVKRARFLGCEARVIYGNLRAAGRSSMSAAYLRELAQIGARAHLVHTYPFVFEAETGDLCEELRLRIPDSHSFEYKMLLWEFVHQLGHQETVALLNRASARTVLSRLRDYPAEYYPSLVRLLHHSQKPSDDVERLRKRRFALTKFSAGRFDILQCLFQLSGQQHQLLQQLADAAVLVEPEWDFVSAHLGDRDLLQLFLGPGAVDPRLRAAIKASPESMRELLEHNRSEDLLWAFDEFGADVLPLIKHHGRAVFYPLHKYGADAYQMLSGPRAGRLMELEKNPQTRGLLERWYQDYQNLAVVESVDAEPELLALINRTGLYAVEIYRRERNLEIIRQSHRVAALTFHTLEDAYRLLTQLRSDGMRAQEVLHVLTEVQSLEPGLFRSVGEFQECVDLTKSLHVALREASLRPVVELYHALGSSALEAYSRYGARLLPLIEATGPFVVNVLLGYPDTFPDLLQYGRLAYDLIRTYREQACSTLAGLRDRDLTLLLTDSEIQSLLTAWHASRGNLQALAFLAADPQLAELAKVHGLTVLDVYASDGDLSKLRDVIAVLPNIGLPLEDVYSLLDQVNHIPYDEALDLLCKHCALFEIQESAETRARLLDALCRATTVGADHSLAALYEQVGLGALHAFDRFGRALFPLAETTAPTVVNVLNLYPDVFPDLQRYGRPAYDLIKTYREAACRTLLKLRDADLGFWLTDSFVLALVQVWHREHQDLRALELMVAHPPLLDWTQRYCALAPRTSRSGDGTDLEADALRILRLYDANRAPEALSSSLSIAEENLLTFGQTYSLLRAVECSPDTTQALIRRHAHRLRTLSTESDRCAFLTVLCGAQSNGAEEKLIALYEAEGMIALEAYRHLGQDVIQLAESIDTKVVPLLAHRPDLLASLKRYGEPAYRFVGQYGEVASDKLVEGFGWGLDKVLGQAAQPVIKAWYDARHNLEIVNILVIDWPIMHYVEKYGDDLKPIWIWLSVRTHRKMEHPTALIVQYEQVLFDARYDYSQLTPLIGVVQPEALEAVVARFYGELIAYPNVDERVRFCKALTQSLDFAHDADRFVELTGRLDRLALLSLVEVVGRPLLDLLHVLHPRAQAQALSQMQVPRLDRVPNYVQSLLRYHVWFTQWKEQTQVKIIQATSRCSIDIVAQAWRDYGDAGVDEIIRTGKLGVFFKIRHRRRS